jgi:outer membrane biosynthesis protein TonB
MWRKTEKNEEYLDKNISCFLLRLEDKYYSIIKQNASGIFDFSVDLPDDVEISIPIVEEDKPEPEPISEPLKVKSPVKVPEKKKVSNIKKQEEPQEEPKEEPEPIRKIFIPKKITLKEIQDLAQQRDIPIQKKSEKTGKMLNKTIEELREDILGK